jgi:hypothetical protein
MFTIEDLQYIRNIIYDPSSTYESRQEAERKLEAFQNIEGSWSYHIQLLNSVDDQLLFLLCIGLQKIIWKMWNRLQLHERELIISTIIQLYLSRFFQLPLYARSKLEQTLSTICKVNKSYQVIFQLIEKSEQMQLNQIIGVSTFRTVLDDVLGNDSRLSPNDRNILSKLAFEIAPQLIVLPCQLCVQLLQTSINESEELLTSLQLIKVILAKVSVGPHVNLDVLNLLFSIAELSATKPLNFSNASLIAVEALTEFMSKRYVPSMSGATPNTVRENTAAVLVELVSKAASLLQLYW